MWRRDAMRKGARAALGALTALALVGAGSPFKKRNDPPPKVEEAVTNVAEIQGRTDLRLEGVGLVVGLTNTGGETPPSWAREHLVDEMRKAGVENPEKLLGDPSVSIVIVRVSVPTGTTKSDRLDVELHLPAASGTTSLAGGKLLSCRLKEIMIAGGTPREGPELATAQGPVMIGTEVKPDDPKCGRVLGGAHVRKDSPFRIDIKENRRSFKTSQLIQQVVNRRFHQTEGIKQNGMATAKTDAYLELRVPQVYHHNHYRYFRVLRLLPLVESPALREMRTAAWGKELLDPTQAGIAALRLEGLGVTAIDALKGGLASPNDQVKFFAAEALAYLNDASGADVLAENAIKKPEFRAYALAALAATDQPASRMKLIKLMDVADIPVRYGAFNSLRTLDESDPFLGRVRVLDEPPADPEEGESMSLAINQAMTRRRPAQADPFALYVVDSDGPPMIHVARTRRCEIVVFGRNQKLLTPIVLGTGPILLNASDGDDTLQISKISSGRPDDPDAKVHATLDISDVIRQTASLGAKYPDVVGILQAASRQKNMPGPLVVDAIPGPTADYDAAAILGKDTTKKDDEVTKTKLETPSRWPRFLRGFGRAKETPKADEAKSDAAKPEETKSEKTKSDDPARVDSKKDDAVTRSRLEPEEEKKPRLLDRLRRRRGD